MSSLPADAARWARSLLLFAFGATVSLLVGRKGLQPIDHSIVFDGAWRLLDGQIPFRDFGTPAGLTPAAMQVPFFRILGVDWFAYCLHAALVNGLFGLTVRGLLRLLGAEERSATLYALAATLFFYPPVGVPYPDQHAFFFCLAASLAAIAAVRATAPRWRRLAPWLVAPLLFLAWFSKPNPTGLCVPIVLVTATAVGWRRSHWRGAAMGLAASLAAASAAVFLLDLDVRWMRELLWTLPGRTGAYRAALLLGSAGLLPSLLELAREWDLWMIWLTAAAAPPILLSGLRAPSGARRDRLLPGFLAVAWIALCMLFTRLTFRSVWSGCPLVLPAWAMLHLALLRSLPPRRGRALAFAAAVVLPGIVAARDVVTFHLRVNRTGVANLADRASARPLPPALAAALPELSTLQWSLPENERFTAEDLAALRAALRAREARFFVLGDLQILYALAGKPSTSPVLWFHPDLTFATRDGRQATAEFECRLLEQLDRLDVRRVVRQGSATQLGVSPDTFPRAYRSVLRSSRRSRSFGSFQLIDLAPRPWRRAAAHCRSSQRTTERRRPAPLQNGSPELARKLAADPAAGALRRALDPQLAGGASLPHARCSGSGAPRDLTGRYLVIHSIVRCESVCRKTTRSSAGRCSCARVRSSSRSSEASGRGGSTASRSCAGSTRGRGSWWRRARSIPC